jgi:hypothetical protein
MNREDGFAIADVDVGLFHDQKVIALARRLHNKMRTAAHVAVYTNLILESWAAGDRLSLDDALPAWWVASADDVRAELQAVGLIDDESRVPLGSWESWFVPAFDRREKRRESGAEGGRRSWQSRRDKRRRSNASSDASATPNPSVLPADRHSDRQAGRGPSQPTAIGAVVNEVLPTCDICQELLSGEPWKPRKANNGRMENVHVRCYSETALVAS